MRLIPFLKGPIGTSEPCLRVCIARNFWRKAIGLSWQKRISGDGLLFLFSKPCRPIFWMLGMRFAIDIVWIAMDGRVIGWHDNLKPPQRPFVSVFLPWRLQRFKPQENVGFALEMQAGSRLERRIDENTVFEMAALQ